MCERVLPEHTSSFSIPRSHDGGAWWLVLSARLVHHKTHHLFRRFHPNLVALYGALGVPPPQSRAAAAAAAGGVATSAVAMPSPSSPSLSAAGATIAAASGARDDADPAAACLALFRDDLESPSPRGFLTPLNDFLAAQARRFSSRVCFENDDF